MNSNKGPNRPTTMEAPPDGNRFVHDLAICESDAIGGGTRIWAFAHVMEGACVGENCNICDHVFLEGGARVGDGVTVKNGVLIWNGVVIEDHAFVGPGVVFTNDRYPRSRRMTPIPKRYERGDDWLESTFVGTGATIGAGAVVICGTRIGAFACVGAGAIVTRDVPDHALVLGQPAVQKGWVCRCGLTLDAALRCHECESAYMLDEDRLIVSEPARV